MSTQVSEQQARQVAEAAREQDWKLPSFGKELFLGNFRLDLIHPQPKLDAAGGREGRGVPGDAARRSSTEHVDPLEIERDSKIPDAVVDGLKQHRRAGHEGARAVRRPRPLAGLLQQGARAGRHLALLAGHAALGAPVDRRRRAADAVRLRGAEAASGCRWSPRTTSRRSCSPSPTSAPTRRASAPPPTPTEGGYVLNGRKLWATNGAIADIVVVMARVPKVRGPPRRHQRLRARLHDRGRHASSSRNAFMGLRGIENSVTAAQGRLRAGGEPDRQGGHGASRSPSPRSTPAAWRCRRSASATPSGRRRSRASGRPSACSGAARSASTTPSRRRSPTSPRRRSAWRRCSTSPRAWPTRRATTSASRPRSRSSTRSENGWQVLDDLDADPRRPRLRDRRVAEGARREADPGRAGAARHAHQPHLRGLDARSCTC